MEKPLIGKKILIVEDEAVFRSLLNQFLSSMGAVTVEAEDGLEAIETEAACRGAGDL